jgi:ADP-ribose pyrophosphatase
MSPDLEKELGFPDLRLEVLEDLSPRADAGFLRIVRRRMLLHYPDGSRSEPFVYDEVARKALDAVVIAAHYESGGRRFVYLRSALRPPVCFRDPARSPVPEPGTGAVWELPAGLIEQAEQSAAGVFEAARRELAEELGFAVAVRDFQALGPSTLACPGVLSERHFFVAVRVDPRARTEPTLDGSALERFGRVVALPLSDALAACRSGRIEDAKTELGLRRLSELALGSVV